MPIVGLLFSKAAIRDLTDTLGSVRVARWEEGRACSSALGSTDRSRQATSGAANTVGNVVLGPNVFAGSCPA